MLDDEKKIMKKMKCHKYIWYSGSAFFGLLGMSNLFGLQQWSKYYGWQEPSKLFGIILLAIAIAVYKYIDKTCKQIETVKCKECGEVFSDIDLKNSQCPTCGGELIEVNEFYKTSNKY